MMELATQSGTRKPAWSLRRVPRTSVKGYSSLRPWALRRRADDDERPG